MESNSHMNPCDMKMSLQIMQLQNVESKDSYSTTSNVQQNDGVQTIHLARGAKEEDILKAAAAVTNGASSVILEGVDASALFPHGVNRDGSITVEWEAGKNTLVQAERSRSDDSVLVSQAQALIDLFHELFRTSNTPLQIVLEPQESGELVYLEQKLSNGETNLSQEEINIEDCKEIVNHQDSIIKNDKELNKGKESKPEQSSAIEYLKQPEALSTVQLIHRCYYCSFASETVSFVIEHVKIHHPNKPVRTKTISGRNCPYCCIRLEQTAFFQHMRQYHGDAHPFRCGYCSFMGRDLNQVKHHCSKKHQEMPFKCFRRSKALSCSQGKHNIEHGLETDENAADSNVEKNPCKRRKDSEVDGSVSKNVTLLDDANNEEGEAIEEVESFENKFHYCPICQRKIKTLKYLKVHMRVHSRGRYKCGYCSYLSVYLLQVLQHCKKRHRPLQPRVKHHELDPSQNKSVVKNIDKFMEEISKKCSRQPPDPDARKWARKYSCPHCEYTCSYGASYRRHLTIHTTTPFPFRCKYCSFEGREKYYVRRHIQRIHRGFPTVVVKNDFKDPLVRVEDHLPLATQEKVSIGAQGAAPKDEIVSKKLVTRVKAVSRRAAKPLKVIERLESAKSMEEMDRSSEASEVKEMKEQINVKEEDFREGDEDTVEASERRDQKMSNSGELENILEVAPDLEVTRNGKEMSCSQPTNNGVNLGKIPQKPKSKKAGSKKKLRKNTANSKNCAKIKNPIILPKGFTSVHSSANQKLDTNAVMENDLGESIVSDESSTAHGLVCVNLQSLIQGEGAEKKRGPVGISNDIHKEKNVAENVGGVVANMPDSSRVKDGKGRTGCRKKRNREKSTHKAWEFVAYKDGTNTYCVCGARTVNKAFYKHIKKHMDSKPFGCGYCSYRSIERAKVRVHHTFVHPGLPVIVNESQDGVKEGLEKRQAVETYQNPETVVDGISKHTPQSVAKKNSTPRSQVLIDFQCPICCKKISYHTYTIRRHFFSHYDYRPYQCGRCDFRGCSPGEVKQHSVYHGADLCPIVIPSGQEPPEGLEQLVADCFKEMRTKLGKKTRKGKKLNGPKVRNHSERVNPISGRTYSHAEGLINSQGLQESILWQGPSKSNMHYASAPKLIPINRRYKLITKEAICWQETLSRGECPWCKKKVSSLEKKIEKLLPEAYIENHFKLHFYKPMQDSSDNYSGSFEGPSVPIDLPSSLEEKDAIVMNGLMYYFIHHPIITDSDDKELSKEKESRLECGEVGIINCPDGMPQGTIQITDSLLADLRHLLWGQEPETSPKKSSRHTGQKCDLNFGSVVALQLHSEYHEPLDSQQSGMKDDLRSSQYPLWDVVDANGGSQAQDAEVGVLLLGDDIEMTTAVVVVNPEVGECRDVEMEVSI